MEDLLEAIKTRRSVRKYNKEAIPAQGDIDKIIEAGLYAASSMGKQNTIIIQITNKQIRDEISDLNRLINGRAEGFDPFYGAPAMLIVLAKKDWPDKIYDGSLVMGNLMLAAHSLGIDTCWIHRAKEEFETEWGKRFLESLGITEEYEGVGHCALGYGEGKEPIPSKRKEGRVFYVKEG